MQTKKEVLVLGTPKQRAKISVPSISVNNEILNIPIGNLGSVFDPSMNMAAHVSKAVKGSLQTTSITFETSEGSENT